MSYLRNLKATLVEALKHTFNGVYPDERLQDLHVSIEYPIEPQEYPGIWVDFEETELTTAGINHFEFDEEDRRFLRWKYAGAASYTIAALSSLERDRIYDEMVKVMAFGRSSESLGAFREYIEDNPHLAINFNFDDIEVHGTAATPGTPWGTDEIIYERTVVMQAIGEFTTDVNTGDLGILSKIIIDARTSPSTEEAPANPLHWDVPNLRDPLSDWH